MRIRAGQGGILMALSSEPTTVTGSTSTAAPYQATQGEDTVTVILAFWLFAGGALDVWAHTNIIKTLEGFITPWHIVMYTGYLATGIWVVRLAYRRRAQAPKWWRDGWPVGYKVGAVGGLLVFFGGTVDGIWHTIFGIESGLDAKLSPSHNVIILGSVLLGTSPMRSWWSSREGGRRTVTGVASMTIATTMATHLFTVLSAFGSAAPIQRYLHDSNGPSETAVTVGYDSYVITTVTLLIGLLLTLRRRTVPGVVTAAVFMVSLFEMIRYEFPSPQLTAAVLAVVGAAVADVVLVWLDTVRGFDAPYRLIIAGAVIPVAVWSGHLIGLELGYGIHWPVELWTGTVTVTAGLGALLGTLASRPVPALGSNPLRPPGGIRGSSDAPAGTAGPADVEVPDASRAEVVA
jgi:hypothetical protein